MVERQSRVDWHGGHLSVPVMLGLACADQRSGLAGRAGRMVLLRLQRGDRRLMIERKIGFRAGREILPQNGPDPMGR
jgi:hypothetical protein